MAKKPKGATTRKVKVGDLVIQKRTKQKCKVLHVTATNAILRSSDGKESLCRLSNLELFCPLKEGETYIFTGNYGPKGYVGITGVYTVEKITGTTVRLVRDGFGQTDHPLTNFSDIRLAPGKNLLEKE